MSRGGGGSGFTLTGALRSSVVGHAMLSRQLILAGRGILLGKEKKMMMMMMMMMMIVKNNY